MAAQEFFKPGNLMALRELSLRRAAARVDDQMRAYMESRAIHGPWPAAQKLLVCVSGSPFSEHLIRTTRRLADEMKAPWHALYIEAPGSSKQVMENRERVWHELRLAESLGAEVAQVTAAGVAEAIIDYAVRQNVTRIVVGKPRRPRWREFLHPPLVDQIIHLSGTIDVYVVSITSPEKKPESGVAGAKRPVSWSGYLTSVALVTAASLVCELVRRFLSPTNLVMIYLLAVVLAALRHGLRPAIMTAFLSVLAFDFFFVPPRFTLTVADTEYLITFLSLFAVGVVISTLVSKARERADTIREREVQTASLYYLSRDLAAAAGIGAILNAAVKNIGESLNACMAILLPEGERLEVKAASHDVSLNVKESAVADWAFRNRKTAGRGTETLGSADMLYLPLQTSASVLGVLGIRFKNNADYASPQSRRLLEAFVAQTALAIERVRLVKQAEQSEILQARESLERALLNSVSHDLRTPLVSITGVLDTIRDKSKRLNDEAREELLAAAWDEAARLNRFVGNLLDMTRLEAGAIKLKEEPCDIQDVIGCALAALDKQIGNRRIDVHLQPDLPLVNLDMALMTQVLVNLLDNALKYSPAESSIEIAARVDGPMVRIEISDYGPGVPDSDLKRIFDKFYRIPVPEGARGTGLGLSICKGIVEAHEGSIQAENRVEGGLRVIITLTVGR